MMLPQTPTKVVRGHPSPRFLPLDVFGVSISAHLEHVIGPCTNGFPGPAVALDGPDFVQLKIIPIVVFFIFVYYSTLFIR